MGGEHEALINQVVNSFSESLDPVVREAIGNSGFESLGEMVREALARQADAILDRLEGEIRRARAETVERPVIEI